MTGSLPVRAWIDARVPPVPRGYVSHIVPERPEADVSVEALTREARSALERALHPEGRERLGAFDLLAADGFSTWACEAALDAPDPDAALTAVLDGLLT